MIPRRIATLLPILGAVLFVAASLAGAGCGVVAVQEYRDEETRPAAPPFALVEIDGDEVSREQLTGSVVALYMTNL